MSRPIKITKSIKDQLLATFLKNLEGARLDDGKITIEQQFEYDDKNDRIAVMFTPKAFTRMQTLIFSFDSEIAWHGVVRRLDDVTFLIEDILVYPQVVTGVTVNTDQDEYQKWMQSLDDDTFNSLHMQGHSHVNMGVSPSGVDLGHQQQIVSQLDGDHFYIFMIYNRKMEANIKVYDMASNTLYETKDIDVGIADDDNDILNFLADAKAKTKKSTTVASATSTAKNNSNKTTTPATHSNPTTPYQGAGYYAGKYGHSPANAGSSGYGFLDGFGQPVDYDKEIFGNRMQW